MVRFVDEILLRSEENIWINNIYLAFVFEKYPVGRVA